MHWEMCSDATASPDAVTSPDAALGKIDDRQFCAALISINPAKRCCWTDRVIFRSLPMMVIVAFSVGGLDLARRCLARPGRTRRICGRPPLSERLRSLLQRAQNLSPTTLLLRINKQEEERQQDLQDYKGEGPIR